MDKKERLLNLPKLELHAHLNGSLSPQTLTKLKKLEGSCSQLEVWPICVSDLKSCFDLFAIAHNLTKSPQAVKLATVDTIKEFVDDGVIYLELRSTPRNEKGMTKREYLQALVDGVLDALNIFTEISIAIIVSINRGESIVSAEENVSLALEFSKQYPKLVVGIDLCGNPSEGSFSQFAKLLASARDANLRITLHCGEIENEDEVSEMLAFEPDRLGHCTVMSEANLQTLIIKAIPVEVCITSNIKCGTVKNVRDHHFNKLKTLKHPTVLSTDDKGVFGTTLTEEYTIASETFNLSLEECFAINLNAVNYIFADESTKHSLTEKFISWRREHLESGNLQF